MRKNLWIFALVSLLMIGVLPVVEADTTTYPDNIEVIAGTQTGSFPRAIEDDDSYVLEVSNSSSYQYPSEYWIEQGDQGMTGTFPDDIEEDDANYIQVADWGQNLPLDDPRTKMHWNWTNVPAGSLYQLQHKGYFSVDDPYCFLKTYQIYVWDGGAWNSRVDMADKSGSGNEAWDYYNLTSDEYNSGSPEIRIEAFCGIDEQETIIRDYANVIEILVYRQVDVTFEWINLPMGRQRLDFQAKATGTITAQIYNGTASDWENLTIISTSWTDYSYEVIFDWYNSSNPSLRFYGNTTSGTISIELDYVEMTDIYLEKIDELEDRLDAFEKRLKEIQDKLDDIHSGEIIDPTNKQLPYPPGTREGLDTDYYILGDPNRELFFNWYSDPDAAASVTLPIAYDSSWSDVDALTDELWLGDYSGTLYINDTTDNTKILQTTTSYSHFLVNATSQGHALTVEVTTGTVKISRMARVHTTFAFDWFIDPHTMEHRTTFTVSNDLTENWREVVIVVAGNPDYSIEASSVIITDLDNNVELTTKNYEMTMTSFRMGLSSIDSSTSRSFKILYSPYAEGSEYQEPVGIWRYDAASSGSLNNVIYLVDEVAITNPNSIDCEVGTRISIDASSAPGEVAIIRVVTADGSHLTQGPPLGNQWFAFYGLEIPGHSTVTVSVYIKTQERTLDLDWFKLWTPIFFTWGFLGTVAACLGAVVLYQVGKSKKDSIRIKQAETLRTVAVFLGTLTVAFLVIGLLL